LHEEKEEVVADLWVVSTLKGVPGTNGEPVRKWRWCSVVLTEKKEREKRGGGGRRERKMGWWPLGFGRIDKGEGAGGMRW
jgi:hypothetical protein